MVSRCTDSGLPDFHMWGGRGITVCDRWLRFENFLADMGVRPPGTTIDRYPNNDGNYEPGNTRWATRLEQCRNTRRNVFATINDQTLTIAEWAEISGIKAATLYRRHRTGVRGPALLEKPVCHKYRIRSAHPSLKATV